MEYSVQKVRGIYLPYYLPGMRRIVMGRYNSASENGGNRMSGIYIKGVEMAPRKVFADLEGGWRQYKAVPVPDHGRLIDAFDTVKKLTDEGYYNTAEIVSDMPTIIPASGGTDNE